MHMVRTAYLVAWLDKQTGQVVDVGVYSEATPTTMHAHLVPCAVMKADQDNFEMAKAVIQECVASDRRLQWAKNLMGTSKEALLYRAHKMLVALSLTPTVEPVLQPLLRKLVVDMNEALK